MNTLFFNRVPKCGSETMKYLIMSLGKVNNFRVFRQPIPKFRPNIETEDSQRETAEWILDLREPAAYLQHINYFNFTKLNFPRPIYMNLVRDPIERLISHFYFKRSPDVVVARKVLYPDENFPDIKWLKLDFETCVRTGHKECVFEEGSLYEGGNRVRQTLYFCGHNASICMPFNSQEAMQLAKHNVEAEYAVVGTWEDKNITLAVLEQYIPMFFRNATSMYNAQNGRYRQKANENSFKSEVSDEIKNIVRKNFTREIEFYQFCRQRLHKQYLAIQLKTDIKLLNKNQIF